MKFLFLFFICFSSFAQNKCYVENPSEGNEYRIYNKTQQECESWFNENKSDGSFNCSADCKLKVEDITEIIQERELEKLISKRVVCGDKTIKYIAKLNARKQLSKEQRKQMVSSYSMIFDLLKAGSTDIAIDEISAINPDGTIVTAQDKTDIVSFINGCE